MKARIGLVAALLVFGSSSSQAATVSLGNLGPPSVATFGDVFSQAGSFTDIYTFNLAASADVLGLVLTFDVSPTLNINIASSHLFSGDPNGSSAPVAANVGCATIACSWNVASAGAYFLEITGNVTSQLNSRFNLLPVGYGGAIASVSESVSEAPLPAALPLFATGLGAMGLFGWWRKRKAQAVA